MIQKQLFAYILPNRYSQRLFEKLRALSRRCKKGHFFTIKKSWKAPLTSSYVCSFSIVVLINKFLKKIKHQGQCLEVRLSFSLMQRLVLKHFTKFTGKHLSWSYFLTKLQFSRPETLLKRDSSTGIFLAILSNFSKHLIYRPPGWLLMLIPLCLPRFYSLITLCLFFFHFFSLLLIIAVMGICSESVSKWRFNCLQ